MAESRDEELEEEDELEEHDTIRGLLSTADGAAARRALEGEPVDVRRKRLRRLADARESRLSEDRRDVDVHSHTEARTRHSTRAFSPHRR